MGPETQADQRKVTLPRALYAAEHHFLHSESRQTLCIALKCLRKGLAHLPQTPKGPHVQQGGGLACQPATLTGAALISPRTISDQWRRFKFSHVHFYPHMRPFGSIRAI